MKFSQSRSKDNQAPQQQVLSSAASSAMQQSILQQQQAERFSAISQSPQQLLQRQQLQGLVSQQMSLDEEEPLQGKFATVQQAALEEEEPLQGKFDAAKQLQLDEEEPLQGKFEPAAVRQRQAEAPGNNNTGMPDQLKSGIESLSGYAMDDVKVHYNSAKPAAMQAHAYAQGTDIHLAPGQEKHLPHEAWHVVQQKQGRVKATTQLKGEAINDDPGLEHEADVMGARALQNKSETIQKIGVRTSFGAGSLNRAIGANNEAGISQLWRKVNGQGGEFEGEPAHHHLHRIGSEEHYRYGTGHTIVFMRAGVANRDAVERAIEACSGGPTDIGRAECLTYLQELLSTLPEPKPLEIKENKKEPPKDDKPPRKKIGKKITDKRTPSTDPFDALF